MFIYTAFFGESESIYIAFALFQGMGITRTGGVKQINDSADFEGDKLEDKLGKSAKIGGGHKKPVYHSDPVPIYHPRREYQKQKSNPFQNLKYSFKGIKIKKNFTWLVLVISIVSFFLANIQGIIGQIFDYVFFFSALFLMGKAEWKLLKIINHVDMRSDLKFFGVRLLGLALVVVACFWLFVWFMFISLYTFTQKQALPQLISLNLGWLIVIFMGFLGLFCLFRTARRYTVIGIWR